MKNPTEDSQQMVERFLGKLGEPVPSLQVERSIGRVRNRLEDAEALSVSVDVQAQPLLMPLMRWSALAAAIFVLVVGGAVQALLLRPNAAGTVAKTISGQIYWAGVSPLLPLASRVGTGQTLRTGAEAGTLELLDGSRIEMGPQAELSIVPAVDGMSVQLNSGTVIVTAAKQRHGHLYVKTKDLIVSVVGTVFSVSAESSGSRVSVIEGEVHVQQGPNEQTLLPGQQASTSPALGPLPVQTELKWSKSVPELVALLQQSAAPVPPPVPVPQSISVSIQGTVKLASKGEGVQGVDVIACAARAADVRAWAAGAQAGAVANGNPTNPRVVLAPVDTPSNGPIIRNKTFFFALWDGVLCLSPLASAKTDAAGRFQLKGLPPGEYAVSAQLDGYFGQAANGTYPQFASQTVMVDAQQPVPEVSFSLIRGGTISGHIRDAEGKLLSNFNVWAAVPPTGNSVLSSLEILVTKATDDRGEYRLFSLPPGEYYVVAGAITAKAGVFRYSVGWTPGPETTLTTAGQSGQTFFPSVLSPSEAITVVVKEGEDVSGIDIVMRPPMPTDAPVRRLYLPADSPFRPK